MALDRKEVLALVQEYMGLTPRDKGLRSVLEMSDELTDKIMKLDEKWEIKCDFPGIEEFNNCPIFKTLIGGCCDCHLVESKNRIMLKTIQEKVKKRFGSKE